MMESTTFTTADGTVYEMTAKGYCYKSTGNTDKKGNPVMMRICKAVFEKAFDEYTDEVSEADEELELTDEVTEGDDREAKEAWTEAEADAEHEEVEKKQAEQKAEQEKSDREAEEKVNGKTKKATKKRAPRNKNLAAKITFEGKEIGITEKQKDFMLHLTDTDFWEQGVDSSIWVDCLCEQIGGQFENKPMTVGAMVSTLREKGLVATARDDSRKGKPQSMVLTDAGKAMAQEIGLN